MSALSTRDRVLTTGDTPPEGVDCILVLGCGVYADGSPTPMLYDRLARGVELYGAGWADVLLLSGDNRSADYNELATMDRVAQDLGAPAEAITLDYAGLSTYDSLYRAREIFGVASLVIVTQDYHLSRALYLAEALGLEAWGVAAEGEEPAWAALPGTPGDPGPGQGFLLGHLPAGGHHSGGAGAADVRGRLPRRGAVGYCVPFGWAGLFRSLGAQRPVARPAPGGGPAFFGRKPEERTPGRREVLSALDPPLSGWWPGGGFFYVPRLACGPASHARNGPPTSWAGWAGWEGWVL